MRIQTLTKLLKRIYRKIHFLWRLTHSKRFITREQIIRLIKTPTEQSRRWIKLKKFMADYVILSNITDSHKEDKLCEDGYYVQYIGADETIFIDHPAYFQDFYHAMDHIHDKLDRASKVGKKVQVFKAYVIKEKVQLIKNTDDDALDDLLNF